MKWLPSLSRTTTIILVFTLPAISEDRLKAKLGDLLPSGAIHPVGTLRLNFGRSCQHLALAQDGSWVAAHGHGEIRVWETRTGRPVAMWNHCCFSLWTMTPCRRRLCM